MKHLTLALLTLLTLATLAQSASACHGRKPGKRPLKAGKAVVRFVLPGR